MNKAMKNDLVKELKIIIDNYDIINILLKNPSSATEIAKIINQSISRINQKLQLLEAHGIIKRIERKEKTVGKPKKVYKVNKEEIIVLDLCNGFGDIKKVYTKEEKVISRIITYHHKNNIKLLEFMINNKKLIQSKAIGIVNIDSKIEILVIDEKPEEVLKEINGEIIKQQYGMDYKVFCYSQQEFMEGLKRRDLHFIGLINVTIPIYDPLGIIKLLKEVAK